VTLVTPLPLKFSSLSRAEQITWVTDAVALWQERLKLQHVKVELNFDDAPDDEDAVASINPSNMYDWAMIRFGEEFWDEESWFEVNRIIVHELLHFVCRDLDSLFELSSRQHSFDARSVLQHQWNVATEGVIDKLAHRFVEGMGEA